MHLINSLLTSLAVLPICTAAKNHKDIPLQQRPNIIMFLVDDMGWQDTSLPFWTEKT
ncbi:MAG: sulfatase, partial [Bacteroidales bacterium]